MTKRALELLALAVLLLAAAVLLDRPPGREAPPSDRILPGFSAAAVRRVTLRRAAAATVVEDGRVDGHPADDDAVRDLLGSFELLAWRRRVPHAAGRGLEAPRLAAEVQYADGATATLRVGDRVPALGRTWLWAGGADDFLVDDFAARALDQGEGELRRRAVFTSPDGDLQLDEVVVRGQPPCVVVAGRCVRAAADRVAALREALAGLRLARFLDALPPAAPSRELRLGDDALTIYGPCPGEAGARAVKSAAGLGCLDDADLAPVLDAPTTPLAWVETRLLAPRAADVDRIAAGGVELERRGGGWFHGADPLAADAVRDLLDELASFRGVPSLAAPVEAPPPGALTLRVAAGADADTLVLLPGPGAPVVRRLGDPVALTVHPAARAAFALDLVTLGDRRVLAFDPFALTEVRAGAEIAVRGATAEDWRLTAPAALPADGPTLIALRDAASHLTARRAVAAAAAPAHALDPPRRRLNLGLAGAAQTLDLGADAAGGCYVRAGDRPTIYLVAPATCAMLAAPFATRDVYTFAPDEVRAVTIAGRRLERHGRWFAGSAPLDEGAAAAIASLIRSLARAPSVAGYGPLPGGVEIVLETDREKVTLRISGDMYARTDRPVRYRLLQGTAVVVRGLGK